MTVSLRPALTISAVVSATLAGAALSAASAMPAVSPATSVAPSNLVKVHDDGDRYWRHHSYHRRYRGRVVDAPFAHVYTGRHGQHIVAPFVDLWVPR